MGINFPSSPTAGQVFLNGSTKYTFTSGAWRATALGTALPYNFVINGQHIVSQQNGRTAGTANGYFPSDQFVAGFNLANISTASEASANGVQWHARLWNNAVGAAPAAGELMYIDTRLEGFRIMPFLWGTTTAKQVVLRFKARITAGVVPHTFGVSIRSASPYIAYVKNFVITTLTNWHEFILVVPGPTTGTWATDSTIGLSIFFTPTAGTDYSSATQNAWVSGNYICGTGTTNFRQSASRGFDIADIGLYLDPDNTGLPPTWETIPELQTYMECMRYWYKSKGWRGVSTGGASVGRGGNPFLVDQRVAAATAIVGTATAYDQATQSALTGLTNYANIHTFEADFTTAAATSGGRPNIFPLDSGYMATNARM